MVGPMTAENIAVFGEFIICAERLITTNGGRTSGPESAAPALLLGPYLRRVIHRLRWRDAASTAHLPISAMAGHCSPLRLMNSSVLRQADR